MEQLAIRGHATRGTEVIKLLEMFGGINTHNLYGDENYAYYTIDSDKEIKGGIYVFGGEDLLSLTLEQFLEKFPYKVGDKVYNIIHNENQTITNLAWDVQENEVAYQTNNNEYVYVNYLQPYKEETMEIPEKLMPKIDFNEYCKDKYILDLGNYEIKEENGKTYAVRKRLEYPKTYEECCEIIGIEYPVVGGKPDGLSASTYRIDEIRPFIYLLVCRDTYWKIAGEQMGLGKPWKPSKNGNAYCIFRLKGEIVKDNFVFGDSLILEFPTEEMRDAFYENFKDLIEQCKELL